MTQCHHIFRPAAPTMATGKSVLFLLKINAVGFQVQEHGFNDIRGKTSDGQNVLIAFMLRKGRKAQLSNFGLQPKVVVCLCIEGRMVHNSAALWLS